MTKIKYSIAIAPLKKKLEIGDFYESEFGYAIHTEDGSKFTQVHPSLHDRFKPFEVWIVSDEEIKRGNRFSIKRDLFDSVVRCNGFERNGFVILHETGGADKSICGKVIGKAPKNIIDDLIKKRKKRGDEVKVETMRVFDEIELEDGQNFLTKVPAIVLNPDKTISCK